MTKENTTISNDGEKGELQNENIEVPNRLFKYYKYDDMYNESRILGHVFLASPLNFNDPMDCQPDVENNTINVYDKDENDDRLKKKLQELGYIGKDKIDKVSKELRGNVGNEDSVNEVHKKQLRKFGVLCLTETHDNILMWGYYASNGGICIEYDTEKRKDYYNFAMDKIKGGNLVKYELKEIEIFEWVYRGSRKKRGRIFNKR